MESLPVFSVCELRQRRRRSNRGHILPPRSVVVINQTESVDDPIRSAFVLDNQGRRRAPPHTEEATKQTPNHAVLCDEMEIRRHQGNDVRMQKNGSRTCPRIESESALAISQNMSLSTVVALSHREPLGVTRTLTRAQIEALICSTLGWTLDSGLQLCDNTSASL